MDACYSHKAITHPYPGGFSRNGVEKVWLHRSFLATLECVDAVTRGPCRNVMLPQRSCSSASWGRAILTIDKISSNRDGRLRRHPNSVAKRLQRLRRHLIAYKPRIIVDWGERLVGFSHSRY